LAPLTALAQLYWPVSENDPSLAVVVLEPSGAPAEPSPVVPMA
jgi:hypothetical protein